MGSQRKTSHDIIDEYLLDKDWKIKENSNMGEKSWQGLRQRITANEVEKYWFDSGIYNETIRQYHVSGAMHIHDLGDLCVYCVGWDLERLLLNGFGGVAGKVENTPPKHLDSAMSQITNFLFTLQGEGAGAEAISHVDTLLAPFIRYDNLDYDQLKQRMQTFIYNINTSTRAGFQTPFINFSLDLQIPKSFKDQSVILGGKYLESTYGEYQKEVDMFNKAFLQVLAGGDALGRVFTFPIPTYNITKDFDWDDENLDVLMEITGKYGIPYFSNFVNSDLNPDDTRSMCCRLRLKTSDLKSRGGGLFGANPLTGSIGVVTINLSRLGHIAEGPTDFLEKLGETMDVARDSLEAKRKFLEDRTRSGIYPYTKHYLDSIYQQNGKYWVNHFSTIGVIGMNEACLNLFGKDISNPSPRSFSARVLEYIRDKLQTYQRETGNNYNLEATPAEGASYRLAILDREQYPEIITMGNGTPFYTNSTQLPVDYDSDIFGVLDHQDELQSLYTGGTVQHIFLGEREADKDSLKSFIKYVCENYKLPYFTITPSFSICKTHGYVSGEHGHCPTCGGICEVYSRVVGYIRPKDHYNPGKQAEFEMRKKFSVREKPKRGEYK